ncbi:antibiotic biosynthesis monooxygenase [Mammaliicoccus sp. Dog046]|uniref:antibiotic biosynthesis monooxygenase family protein n=1 Tax=Mammaliicoccus sp. Dog046 TaxID=3034233 RepID=UPI002B256D10|nr:antibiotic biosynthesis monooxygenase [Mammaliicoccus sp. Dog046]WQK85768.1 antibiotic biosynthesis monooxygenase [Mammaliicoccus sp. Dog046]
MILESAMLHVKKNKENDFEKSFKEASKIIRSMKGYIKHSLNKCIEEEGQYLLLIEWETLEDHTVGFRESSEYHEWKQLLHHYYEPFPVVEHFYKVDI